MRHDPGDPPPPLRRLWVPYWEIWKLTFPTQLFWMAVYLAIFLVFAPNLVRGQEHKHPVADIPLHQKFYSTWMKPDDPKMSCCNMVDCYPTEIRFIGGKLHARRREDGHWLPIPPEKIERHRDNPDGRNHICAPSPTASYPENTVFCFTLGGGT